MLATAINGCFILKLTLAWCTDVFSLKVRYLELEWNSSNFLPKEPRLKTEDTHTPSKISFEITLLRLHARVELVKFPTLIPRLKTEDIRTPSQG